MKFIYIPPYGPDDPLLEYPPELLMGPPPEQLPPKSEPQPPLLPASIKYKCYVQNSETKESRDKYI